MITVTDVVYVRYQAPDLDRMQEFLLDFGMQVAQRTANALYMRGYGSQPFIHATEHGADARALGFGFLARSEQDLQVIAAEFGVAVTESAEPGGGKRVSVRDPQGLRVDILHGMHAATPLPVRKPLKLNPSSERVRHGGTQRLSAGPSHVMRLGHLVHKVPDLAASFDFYTRHFGFRISDSYWAEQPQNVIAQFLHCGLGAAYTDHHTIALIADSRGGFEHAAFEVIDWDDLALGNQHLATKPYKHSWGIGRHIEGSQIFDYWRDPFGNKIEHWTDGDLVNDEYIGGSKPLGPGALAQWGPPMGDDFMA